MATPAPSSDHDAHHHELRADDYAGLLHEQNHRLAALAHSLTPEQWVAPSLCDGWRACDVLGHITYGNTTPLPKVMALIVFRYRGDVNEGSGVVSKALADELGQAGLLERFDQGMARPIGLGKVIKDPDAYADHVVHELDIRRAIDLPRPFDPVMLLGALDALMTVRSRFFAPAKVAAGLRFRATDLEWAHGPDGAPVVEGPAEDLVLAIAGRPVGLATLTGDGVDELRGRVAA